jgi:hypothetical protein
VSFGFICTNEDVSATQIRSIVIEEYRHKAQGCARMRLSHILFGKPSKQPAREDPTVESGPSD